MELIDKDALVAEIEKLVNNHDKALDYEAALEDVRNSIDTLEVKEVDLEEEIKLNYNPVDGLEFEEYKRIAKYYFELGLKVAQKGE